MKGVSAVCVCVGVRVYVCVQILLVQFAWRRLEGEDRGECVSRV